jgi:hypothetical protein
MHYLIRSFFVWLLFVPVAIANGALRDLVLTPALGDTLGRAVSSLTLSILILGLALLLVDRLGVNTRAGYLVVGAFWLVLTLLFEVSFALLVMGHPMDELLQDYDIFRGRLWLIVLVATFFAPLLAGKMRKRLQSN